MESGLSLEEGKNYLRTSAFLPPAISNAASTADSVRISGNGTPLGAVGPYTTLNGMPKRPLRHPV